MGDNVNGQIYLRGQVWWCEGKTELLGDIPNKRRPHVIVSNNVGNKFAPFVLAVPCTTEEKKDMLTHVKLFFNDYNNTVLCEQIKTIYVQDMKGYICTLDGEAMSQIDEALKISLGLVELPKNDINSATNLSAFISEELKSELKAEPKSVLKQPLKAKVFKTSNKRGHIWTMEEKQEYVEYYTRYGKEKTNAKYKTGNNTKLYYQRFLKAVGGR